MSFRLTLRILVTTGFVGLCAWPASAQVLPPTPQFQVSMDMAVALRAKDAERVLALLAPKAAIMPPDGTVVGGGDDLEKALHELFGLGTVELSIFSLGSGESGTLGFDAGSYDLTIAFRTGEKRKEKGQYLTILRQDGGGHWRVAYGIWSRRGGPGAAGPP
jgi:ketosteroid isomerase-like protein